MDALENLFFSLKLLSAIFYQIFFHQMIALYKLWKMFFILSKKPFPSRDIQAFVFLSSPLFLPVGHFFSGWSQAYYIFWRNTLLRGIKSDT